MRLNQLRISGDRFGDTAWAFFHVASHMFTPSLLVQPFTRSPSFAPTTSRPFMASTPLALSSASSLAVDALSRHPTARIHVTGNEGSTLRAPRCATMSCDTVHTSVDAASPAPPWSSPALELLSSLSSASAWGMRTSSSIFSQLSGPTAMVSPAAAVSDSRAHALTRTASRASQEKPLRDSSTPHQRFSRMAWDSSFTPVSSRSSLAAQSYSLRVSACTTLRARAGSSC
mmetsp:Transcript_29327/g.81976  ORF Transcript_29327/g.81976 Transcript_29327/m.81976 type:complete len:229 (-) Transcript_29327:2631-3317(-)